MAASSNTVSSAKWGKKLETKLSGLAETSSNETILALAKWIGFNRKHAKAFAVSFRNALEKAAASSSSSGKQVVLLTVIHQVLIAEKTPKIATTTNKWNRHASLRLEIGESTLLPILGGGEDEPTINNKLGAPALAKFHEYIKLWDEANSFDGPTLLNQLQRQYQAATSAADTTTSKSLSTAASATSAPATPPPSKSTATTKKKKTEAATTTKVTPPPADTTITKQESPPPPSTSPDTTSKMNQETSTTKTGSEEKDSKEITKEDEEMKDAPKPPSPSSSPIGKTADDIIMEEQEPSGASTAREESKTEPEEGGEKSPKKPKLEPEPIDDDDTSALAPTTAKEESALVVVADASAAASVVVVASSTTTTISYDFESKGIPEQPVAPNAFLESSREIATLQIARDLRNDTAVQLSGLLSSMPEDVQRACFATTTTTEGKAVDNNEPIPNIKARDFSKRTNEAVLDMDLDEQLQNIAQFSEIVQRQRTARLALIQMLIQSRCKFGAEQAALAFYQADGAREELTKRKQILVDAMELEGLDIEEKEKEAEAASAAIEDKLEPLKWCPPPALVEEAEAATTEKQPTEIHI